MKSLPFLWEIGCEEIPAGWLPGLFEQLKSRFADELDKAGLREVPVEVYGTLRRLLIHVPQLPDKQPNRREEITGPPARIARTEDGKWAQAALGFAKKNQIDPNKLEVLETPKGHYVGFVRKIKGQKTSKLLPALMAATLRGLNFPRFMNWDAEIPDGKGPFTFGRPIRWMVCILGQGIIPFKIRVGGGFVKAGRRTCGHRFLAPKGKKPTTGFAVKSFRDYRQGLKRHYVLVDPEERAERLEKEIRKLEKRAGAKRAPNLRGLSTRFLADLVEWPGTVLGSYPEEFSTLPEDVRHTVLIHHQKYLPLEGTSSFIAVTNMSSDPKRFIQTGSERVVVARLRDGRFFWDEDLKKPLSRRVHELAGVSFHEKLGTYEAKVDRIVLLSRRLAELTGIDVGPVERAAELSKCDLTTDMVGEFPELQGIMGGLYAKEQGEPVAVWKAVYSHYRPVGLEEEEDFPLNREGAVVSLADKLDTLAGMFSVGIVPSGSRDPFGLRRTALGVVRVLLESEERLRLRIHIPPRDLLMEAFQGVDKQLDGKSKPEAVETLQDFFIERLRFIFQREFRYDEVNAVFALGALDFTPVGLAKRLEAVSALRDSKDFEALSVAFKRVRNILASEQPGDVDPEAFVEKEEQKLWEAFQTVEPEASKFIANGHYMEALRALSRLRPQVDSFFDEVLVMAKEPRLRENRLALLNSLDLLFTQVADLSEIVADPKKTADCADGHG
jgi:glycyl-tRNA synthetase beta chain